MAEWELPCLELGLSFYAITARWFLTIAIHLYGSEFFSVQEKIFVVVFSLNGGDIENYSTIVAKAH